MGIFDTQLKGFIKNILCIPVYLPTYPTIKHFKRKWQTKYFRYGLTWSSSWCDTTFSASRMSTRVWLCLGKLWNTLSYSEPRHTHFPKTMPTLTLFYWWTRTCVSSLDPDQAQQNVGPECWAWSWSKLFDLLMVFLKYFFWKRKTTAHKILYSMPRVKGKPRINFGR